jgi:hypothetical protein
VGRSQITIDDTGINLITKKINSNWVNTFDTSLNLNARNGISMFGQTVGISGGRSVNIGDSYGGAFDSSVGEVSVTGRDIDLKALNSLDYISLLVLNGIDYGYNVSTVSLAKNKDDPTHEAHSDTVKLVHVIVKKIGNIIFKILKQRKKAENAKTAAWNLVQANSNALANENRDTERNAIQSSFDRAFENYGVNRPPPPPPASPAVPPEGGNR